MSNTGETGLIRGTHHPSQPGAKGQKACRDTQEGSSRDGAVGGYPDALDAHGCCQSPPQDVLFYARAGWRCRETEVEVDNEAGIALPAKQKQEVFTLSFWQEGGGEAPPRPALRPLPTCIARWYTWSICRPGMSSESCF